MNIQLPAFVLLSLLYAVTATVIPKSDQMFSKYYSKFSNMMPSGKHSAAAPEHPAKAVYGQPGKSDQPDVAKKFPGFRYWKA
ncbi:hypothetical protein CROQUDRAFT_662386 [Cronartium quercuum f. sp. fusiforme G11]|uniref:Uncharacterized protein n=1 Tax=Cronartium quercuum f. sp. fusiforme G11 TaxID=708437 RepID=A0A9P6N9K6_9BASI|nr:hypothetical protein CROQUDRAFT_662386 [Cronartium quercuum f. sp. fusiforme G11]